MATENRRKSAKSGAPKKAAARKRSAVKKTTSIPYLAILAVVLIMGFIGFFMFGVEKPSVPQTVNKPVQKKEDVLPEKPQPIWEYEKTLKTKKITVDIPEKKEATRPYQMQCASFRARGDAESLKAKIAFQGLNSEVRKTGNWYRVILGPYERKRLAEKHRHKLQRAKINGCQIWFWR
ncbi:cell division protein [Psychromonas sp. MB-3u-54]|uniref:SPOR domain-containing protein n=1 Tax=Psychromonas sp. MB-3u-54 TaxID=2058319 RepID=UPI000C342F4A|nr:SPOR domain-containing protein [Psychromonas sp. MB-3u-54]PKH01804.1 cell division protein [Psychromonas sp. MB-3u-54]